MVRALRAFLVAIVAAVAMVGMSPAAEPPSVPLDLTQSSPADRELTYNLGATGLRGWIYTKPADFFESVQGRTTTASRQILVTHIGAKSPADGVMQVDDVILGAGGRPFTDDARKSIALAIQEAEKEANGGLLKLTRWRSGKVEQVQLKLRVMGTYRDTAPYDCPKSKRIFDEACKVLEKEPLKADIWGSVNGLALMATGNPEYLPRVRDYARKIAPPKLKPASNDGMNTWESGYRNLFLCEYYLLTGDQEVLPTIKEYTVALAKGQSLYGTFGHGTASPTPDGKLHGSIPPYGPVNEAGLVANLSIVLGAKCGVKDPEVDAAIERACKFFGYFVDKGGIPYGEHEPWPYHENNGKSSMAALMYSIAGNHDGQARFQAMMATAGYANREYGHTGQGFSYLWGALGPNVGGPDAVAAFFKEASWHLDLVRRCDGSFTYDGGEQYGPGKTDDNTYYGKSGYYGLSPTACYVLTYSLPLKKLYITGRDANQANWLSKKDVAAAIASGRFDLDRKKKTAKELVAAFGDWSPVVRGWAAEELAKRPEAKAMVPELIVLAEGPDAHIRQSACEALGYIKSPDALPVLVRLLTHDDRHLRVKAAAALKGMGDAARPVVPEMLKALVKNAEPLEPIVWADPVQISQSQLAEALFKGLLRNSIKGIDRELLYPAIRVTLQCPDGRARTQLEDVLQNLLTFEDVQALAPDILASILSPAPADTMFADTPRLAAIKALTKYHFKEGMHASVDFAKNQFGWASEKRMPTVMAALKTYGSAAREVLPELKELLVFCQNEKFPEDCKKLKIAAVEEAIKAVEAAKDQPELRSVGPLPRK